VVDADPALNQTPESVNRVGVDVTHDVDPGAVLNSLVVVSRFVRPVVADPVIGEYSS